MNLVQYTFTVYSVIPSGGLTENEMVQFKVLKSDFWERMKDWHHFSGQVVDAVPIRPY